MKKLIVTVVVAAFAVVAQAGSDKSCSDKDACCAKMKTAQQTEAGCCSAKQGKMTTRTKKKSNTVTVMLRSPKAKSEAS